MNNTGRGPVSGRQFYRNLLKAPHRVTDNAPSNGGAVEAAQFAKEHEAELHGISAYVGSELTRRFLAARLHPPYGLSVARGPNGPPRAINRLIMTGNPWDRIYTGMNTTVFFFVKDELKYLETDDKYRLAIARLEKILSPFHRHAERTGDPDHHRFESVHELFAEGLGINIFTSVAYIKAASTWVQNNMPELEPGEKKWLIADGSRRFAVDFATHVSKQSRPVLYRLSIGESGDQVWGMHPDYVYPVVETDSKIRLSTPVLELTVDQRGTKLGASDIGRRRPCPLTYEDGGMSTIGAMNQRVVDVVESTGLLTYALSSVDRYPPMLEP